jgi:hypothetical protein
VKSRVEVHTFDISLGGLGIAVKPWERHLVETEVEVVHSVFGSFE